MKKKDLEKGIVPLKLTRKRKDSEKGLNIKYKLNKQGKKDRDKNMNKTIKGKIKRKSKQNK
jgi:hypothetical protein